MEKLSSFPETVSRSISHNKLQSMIAEYANYHQITPLSIRNSKLSPSGQPDLTLIDEDRIAFFEIKSPTGTGTKMQLHIIRRLQRQGITAGFVRWDDWPKVKQWIERRDDWDKLEWSAR